METEKHNLKKPIPLRIIFILNAILVFLPLGFYYAITSGRLDVGLHPNTTLYIAAGYLLSFIIMVFCIKKKQLWGFRLVFLATILISLPASAYIGIVVALLSIALSFHKKVIAYFKSN